MANVHAPVRQTAAARLRRDVRFNAAGEERRAKVFVRGSLVGPECGGREPPLLFRPVQQSEATRLLGRAALEDLHAQPERDARAVLHHRIDGIARIRARPQDPRRDEPAIGVRSNGQTTTSLGPARRRMTARHPSS